MQIASLTKPREPLWELEPHTAAKHEILRRYLKGWIPKLGSRNRRIVYIDAFAGPGRYTGGEDGSPIIALKVARDYVGRPLVDQQLKMLFIEPDRERNERLKSEITALRASDLAYSAIGAVTLQAEYAAAMESLWASLEASRSMLAPTFAFVDPFGVSGLPYEHLVKLFHYPKTELLINMMYEEMNRFRGTAEFQKHLDSFFGGPSWKAAFAVADRNERRRAVIDLFKRRLLEAGAKYVQAFEMRNDRNQTDYLLFFGTQSEVGLEVMKQAMWKVDSSGAFTFSDHTYSKGPMLIGPQPDYGLLRRQLLERFAGEVVPLSEIRIFVLAETSFLRYKGECLKLLESEGWLDAVDPPPNRRKGTFADQKQLFKFIAKP